MNYVAGLLFDDLDIPDDHDAIVSEGDLMMVLFHQGKGRAPRVPGFRKVGAAPILRGRRQ